MSILTSIRDRLFGDPRCFGAKRSGQWDKVRADWLKEHPTCAATGDTKNLEVHHRIPVHVDSTMELDPHNLITLRRDVHLLLGHLDDWGAWNPAVEQDAKRLAEKIKDRP
jgi:hypothetical protein